METAPQEPGGRLNNQEKEARSPSALQQERGRNTSSHQTARRCSLWVPWDARAALGAFATTLSLAHGSKDLNGEAGGSRGALATAWRHELRQRSALSFPG